MNLFIFNTIKIILLFDKLYYMKKNNKLNISLIFYYNENYFILYTNLIKTIYCEKNICNIRCFKCDNCNYFNEKKNIYININKNEILEHVLEKLTKINNKKNIIKIDENNNVINFFFKNNQEKLYIIQTYINNNIIFCHNVNYYKTIYEKQINKELLFFFKNIILLINLTIQKKCNSLEITLILIKKFKNNVLLYLYISISNILLNIYKNNNKKFNNILYQNLFDNIFKKKYINILNIIKNIIKIKKLNNNHNINNIENIEKIMLLL